MSMSRQATIALANTLSKVLEPLIHREKLSLSLKPGSAHRINLLEDVNKTLLEIKNNKQPLPKQLENLKHYSEETEIKQIKIENETVESLCQKLITSTALTTPEDVKENSIDIARISMEEKKPADTSYLVNLPRGKKYLTADESVTQGRQKGPACWYYAFGLIRPRVGKIEKLISLFKNPSLPIQDEKKSEAPDVDTLIEMRKIEKFISVYRKRITQLAERQAVAEYMKYFPKLTILKANEFIEIINNLLITRSLASPTRELEEKKIRENAFLKDIEPYLDIFDQDKPQLKSIKNFLTGFVSQSEHANMRAYIRALEPKFENIEKEQIDLTEKFLKLLGKNPERELQMESGEKDFKIFSIVKQLFSDKQLSMLLSNAIIRAAAEKYHLNKSTWNPDKGFDGLVAALKKEGALSMSAFLGDNYYETPATFEKKSGEYAVYSWKPDAIPAPINENDSNHAIVIVGAESIVDANGELKNTILFVDPSDPSTTDRERKVYRVDYDKFCANIRAFSPNLSTKVWAYCANPTFAALLQTQYKTLHEYHQKELKSAPPSVTPSGP